MIPERTVTVLLTVLIVILVAVVQERSRHLAAIIATMACWIGLRQEWGFLITLAFSAGIWLLIVMVPRWIGHSPR